MALQTIDWLKNKFKSLETPFQQDFWDWLDSYYHKSEALVGEAPNDGNKYVRSALAWVIGGASKSTDLTDMPSDLALADVGDKLIVNALKTAYEFSPSTTSSGFYDRTLITIAWDNPSKTLSLTGTFSFVTASGKKFTKTNDSIVITPVNGAIYVYYDNNGDLQQLNNPNRDQQYANMLITLPVSYFLYSATFGDALFIGDYMKGRVSTGLWVKNFFDQVIENLTPLLVTGLTGGAGSINADAQFGLSESELIFVDNKYNSPTRLNTDTWNVGFFSGVEALGLPDNIYPVLIDTDLGIDVTGRILYNNNGSPLPAGSGNYVWYFLAITNDIEGVDRTLTFMGNSEYGTVGVAEDNLNNEVSTIKNKLTVKQGFNLKKAILYETKSTFANAVKGRIVEVLDLFVEGGGSPSVSVPDDLINGSDASALHMHDSIYLNKTNTAAFTPTADYHPATKKYVDDPKYLEILFSAAPIFDLTIAESQEMPLSGSTVPALSNKKPGGIYVITFAVDGVGGYSIAPDSTFGDKTANAIDDVTSAVANAIYIYTIVVRPNGSTFYTIEEELN